MNTPNKRTPQEREAIDRCHTCDHNGLVELLPADKHHHATLARCPHSTIQILEKKRDLEAHRARQDRHNHSPAPTTPPDR